MKINEECKLYIKINRGRYYDTGHKVGDFDTSYHWAKSIEMADKLGYKISYEDGKYILIITLVGATGPLKLPELYDKLKELSSGT